MHVLMSRYLIHDLESSITSSLLMRVFACFFVFLKLKKGWNYTSLCSLVLLFTHSTMDEKSLKGTANSCCDTIFWCRNSKSWNSCALLSHHLVSSCRLAHNFSAAWSMGSKESGLIPVLLYHVPDPTSNSVELCRNYGYVMYVLSVKFKH